MKPLAATVLVLAITAGLWIASRPGEEATDPEGGTPADAPAGEGDSTVGIELEEGDDGPTVPEVSPAALGESDALQSIEVTPDVRVAVAETDPAPRLAGVVVDARGEPIEGVTVTAFWARIADEPEWREVMKSRADGRFDGDAYGERMPEITARADGATFEPFVAESFDGIRVVGRRDLSVELDVRLPDGSQPQEATLEITHTLDGAQRVSVETWHPGDARIDVEASVARVVAHVEPIGQDGAVRLGQGVVARYSSDVVELDSAELDGGPVRLDVGRRSILTVEVSDPGATDGTVAPWIRIARRADVERPGWSWVGAPAYRPLRLGARPASTHTWEDDVLHVADLEPGEWIVGAGRSGLRPAVEETVTISGGDTRIALVLPDDSSEPFVRVACYGPDGEMLEGVRFFVAISGASYGRTGGMAAAERRSDGIYWLRLSSFDDGRGWETERGAYDVAVTVRSPAYGATVVDLEPHLDDYEVRFAPPGTVIIETEGDAGRGLFASARRAGQRRGLRPVAVSSATKTATLLLQPGDYEIELTRRPTEDEQAGRGGIGVQPVVVAETQAIVVAETQRIAMVVPELHQLDVMVVDVEQPGRRSVVLTRAGETVSLIDRNSVRPDGKGRAVFGGLPAGEYVVSVGGGGSVEVSVPSEGVVRVSGGVGGEGR